MKKHISYTLFIIMALTFATESLGVVVDINDPKPSNSENAELRKTKTKRDSMIAAELDYYVKRHSVDDEGFDMIINYATLGDTKLRSYRPHGAIKVTNFPTPHEGKAIRLDRKGRIVIGWWQADTLAWGIRIDRDGVYAGEFDRHWQASGHGTYRWNDGSYYEGHYRYDMPDGFGFRVTTSSLHSGTWKAGRFVGERVLYTSERIYGIDISRYQHEKGRRRYSIDWKNLRITSLGQKAKRPVSGEVNYPVRFVYVKATEGQNIRNRYYPTDVQQARRAGLYVGAYHFFSTKRSGREQARFFLNYAQVKRDDLAPVLDIEPTDAAIARMGGIEKLFNEVRQWIAIVEKATGRKPILYVSQNFVRKYFDFAPDLKAGYHVWIARYGVYKPDVHLAVWQLSADGRVEGIHGDVDINVFNGYEQQWVEFINGNLNGNI